MVVVGNLMTSERLVKIFFTYFLVGCLIVCEFVLTNQCLLFFVVIPMTGRKLNNWKNWGLDPMCTFATNSFHSQSAPFAILPLPMEQSSGETNVQVVLLAFSTNGCTVHNSDMALVPLQQGQWDSLP